MSKISLPEEVITSFRQKGIDTEKALFLTKTDMGREEFYCDAYTAVTEEGIGVLFCTFVLRKREGASFFSSQKTEKFLEQQDWYYLPIEELDSLKAEEQISVFLVVAKKKDGGEEVLFWASNACRKKVYALVEGIASYQKTGAFPPSADFKEEICPRCGTPYRDPARRMCTVCSKKKTLLKKLFPFFLRYKVQMILVVLTVLMSGAVSVIVPYLKSKVLYDRILSPGDSLYGKISLLVLAVAGATLLGSLVNMVNTIINAKISSFVSYDLKKTIFSSFERLSYSFFTSRHTGRLITQINSDAETLYNFFCNGLPYFFTNVLQIVGVLAVMFFTNPFLTLLVIIPIPFVVLGSWGVMKMFRRLHAENHTHRSRFNGILSDVLDGMRIVKSFSREETEVARFDEKNDALAASNLRISIRQNSIFPLVNLVWRLATYLVWGFGGYLVLKEGLDPGSGISYGELNLFVSYLTMLYAPLNSFSGYINQFASGFNALRRLFEIMDTPPEVKENKDPVVKDRLKGEIRFENVNFSYVPGKKAIDDVSFFVEAGKTLGIVGHTGAGKSTLANLITRLYDVDSGKISIDGIDIRDLSLKTLRENVAIVSQETYLFRGSIMDNIRYANPEATKEEVIAAAKAAGCHDFIMTFPLGYETLVGTNFKTLSGGEKQRVSIARAILKDPAILILDEAPAAMDTKTERKIQEALSAITKNRTTVTIAHRLSTLRDADSLIVIGEGKLLEEGDHSTLLAKKDGTYRKLYELQMEALKTIGIEE